MRESVKTRDLGTVWPLWVLRFALLLLIVLSFDAPWERALSAGWDHQTSMWIIVATVIAAAIWIGWKSASRWLLFGMSVGSSATMIAMIASGTGNAGTDSKWRGRNSIKRVQVQTLRSASEPTMMLNGQPALAERELPRQLA